MKKRKIERIAPNILENPEKKPYQAVPKVVDIDGQEHLLVDIFERVEKKYKFILRGAYNAHDWGMWDPGEGEWSRRSIEDPLYEAPTYDIYNMLSGPGLPKQASWKNTGISDSGKKMIIRFYKGMKPNYERYIREDWWEALKGIEREVKAERELKQSQSRKKSLDERSADVPEIPEDFEDWADQEIFDRQEYIYYKRKGRFADCRCSRCGEDYRIITRRGVDIAGMIERVDPVPVSGAETECLKCGAKATYKARGRMKDKHEEHRKAYLIQVFRGCGTIIRYFDVRKEWYIDSTSGIVANEIGRMYMDCFKKTKVDWHLYDEWNRQSGWYDHNVGGMGNIAFQKGSLYDRNTSEWTDRVKYSGLIDYMELDGYSQKVTYFLETARKYEVEKLIKIGMVNLTRALVEGQYWNFSMGKYKRVEDTLKIRRCRLRMIAEYDNMDLLRVLQLEEENICSIRKGQARGKGEWTEEQIMKAWAMRLEGKERILLKYMTITQLINRVEHYIGREIRADNPEKADVSAQNTAILYRDYLSMRVQHDMDMTRSTSIYPKNLHEAHRKAVNTANAAKNEERLKELEVKYPDVKRIFRKLKALYGYKDGEYFIRPAKNIREILEEGQILHHCVGATDTYIERHNNKVSIIMFLRRVKEPNEPYITVEFNGTEVRQWYGRNDRKPDEEEMQKWIDAWVSAVTQKQETAAVEADTGALMAAV